jgi:hypothetical protein
LRDRVKELERRNEALERAVAEEEAKPTHDRRRTVRRARSRPAAALNESRVAEKRVTRSPHRRGRAASAVPQRR